MNLVLRPSSRAGRREGSLFLRLIHERRSKTIVLKGYRLYPDEWNKQEQAIIYPTDDPARASYLRNVESGIHKEKELLSSYFLTLQQRGRYSVNDLIKLYRKRSDESHLLGYTEVLAMGKENNGQVRTARAYRTVVRGILRFNKDKDIPLSQINSCLIEAFESHLEKEGKLPNTISYYMRNLRAIYNKAVKEKRIINHTGERPFSNVYTGVARTMKRSLTVEEMRSLYDIDFEGLLSKNNGATPAYEALQHLYTAQRYFGFAFYSRGMCFIDLAYLKKENLQGDILRYVRKKTGCRIELKVTRTMQDIIDSFEKEVKDSPYLFPIIRDEKKPSRVQYETALHTQNVQLKKLAAMAGVKKPLSTHYARHSWATIARYKNIPLRVISECLGHTSENTTRIYLDSLNNSVLDAANDLITAVISHRHAVDELF